MKYSRLYSLYLFSILLLISILILSACQSKKVEKISTIEEPPIGGILCVPTPPNLNTAPGKDGHLSPLFVGMDIYPYPISTKDTLAQQYFNQGFLLNYGFNHAEAARAFREVIRLDPECAMGYWGLAYVLGPNYNAPMFPDVFSAAKDAVAQANLYAHNASPKEKALIEAISKRYPSNRDEDPTPYYEDYAAAMKFTMKQYPKDLDIAAMTAEALMDLHPWDLWHKNGRPQSWTPEIIEILEAILVKAPNHPQAMHLYIHTMEASKNAVKALDAANNLRQRVPAAGHLVHMPSHIYIRTGYYHEGVLANERAVKMDSIYSTACTTAGVYKFGLIPHNWHFLAACSALEGNAEKALAASRYMAEATVDEEMLYDPEWFTLQHYYVNPWYIMVKFSQWETILNEPLPNPKLVYPNAIAAYARAMAFIHQNDFTNANLELEKIIRAEKDPAIADATIWDINKITDLIAIARHMASASLAQAKNDFTTAQQHYQAAITIEDQLNYNEPPDWFFSVRHAYGNLLLQYKKYKEAEVIYLQDLEQFPRNGFALNGLISAYEGQNQQEKLKTTRAQFAEAWQWATVILAGSIVQ